MDKEIKLCEKWINKYAFPRKEINRRYRLYRLKHMVEAENDCEVYIPKQAFAEAARNLGYKQMGSCFNMSFKTIPADQLLRA